MSEEKNTITVPVKLVNTRNVLIAAGILAGVVGLIVIFYRKSQIAKAVAQV